MILGRNTASNLPSEIGRNTSNMKVTHNKTEHSWPLRSNSKNIKFTNQINKLSRSKPIANESKERELIVKEVIFPEPQSPSKVIGKSRHTNVSARR